MQINPLQVLSATPPPAAKKFKSSRHAYARIIQLETQLGLEPSLPVYNSNKANAMIAELEARLAAKETIRPHVAAAPLSVSPAPSPVPSASSKLGDEVLTTSLAGFLKMDAASRLQFARDGGHLLKSDFNRLTNANKSAFCVASGKILDDGPQKKNAFGGNRSFGTD